MSDARAQGLDEQAADEQAPLVGWGPCGSSRCGIWTSTLLPQCSAALIEQEARYTASLCQQIFARRCQHMTRILNRETKRSSSLPATGTHNFVFAGLLSPRREDVQSTLRHLKRVREALTKCECEALHNRWLQKWLDVLLWPSGVWLRELSVNAWSVSAWPYQQEPDTDARASTQCR